MQRTEGKTIRAHRIRQTAIANSTSPVRDNYRTGRQGYSRCICTLTTRGESYVGKSEGRWCEMGGSAGNAMGEKLKL